MIHSDDDSDDNDDNDGNDFDDEKDDQIILDVATEAKISFGSSNPRIFLKSMMENLSHDFSDNEIEIGGDESITTEGLEGNTSSVMPTWGNLGNEKRGKRHELGRERSKVNKDNSVSFVLSENFSSFSHERLNDSTCDTPSLSLPDSFDEDFPRRLASTSNVFPSTSSREDRGSRIPLLPLDFNVGVGRASSSHSSRGKDSALALLERIKGISQAKVDRESQAAFLRTVKENEEKVTLEVARLKELLNDRNYTFQNLVLCFICFL